MMKIQAQFDGGNIEYIGVDTLKKTVLLNIKDDCNANEKQWFYFSATEVKNINYTYQICNAFDVSYPEAWATCSIVASYDQKEWFRVSTLYDGQSLKFLHLSRNETVYFALFAPYSYQQHQQLINKSLRHEHCKLIESGLSIKGKNIDLLRIDTDKPECCEKLSIWVIARQHPAETMAEWFIQGFIEALLNNNSIISKKLLASATFYIVPNMNIDGSISGNLRTNAAGVDLNRSWLDPDIKTSPESFYIKEKMKETGVDLFLDIHGDEDIPYAFIAGAEGNPSYSEKLAMQDKAFRNIFANTTTDFCIENGYDANQPMEGNLKVAGNQIGELFNCLSLTIEMPFTDNKFQPDEQYGWSPQRSIDLGSAVLSPILHFVTSSH
jgi:murein tripeptide amidase MpaA